MVCAMSLGKEVAYSLHYFFSWNRFLQFYQLYRRNLTVWRAICHSPKEQNLQNVDLSMVNMSFKFKNPLILLAFSSIEKKFFARLNPQ